MEIYIEFVLLVYVKEVLVVGGYRIEIKGVFEVKFSYESISVK